MTNGKYYRMVPTFIRDKERTKRLSRVVKLIEITDEHVHPNPRAPKVKFALTEEVTSNPPLWSKGQQGMREVSKFNFTEVPDSEVAISGSLG